MHGAKLIDPHSVVEQERRHVARAHALKRVPPLLHVASAALPNGGAIAKLVCVCACVCDCVRVIVCVCVLVCVCVCDCVCDIYVYGLIYVYIAPL